jgi:hypothetical protein
MRLMLTLPASLRAWTFPLAALLGLTFAAQAAQAAQTPPAAPAKAKAVTNAPPAVVELPKSVFVIPTTSEEGRDPFSPLSTRLHPVITPTTTNVPLPVVLVELKGISGTADRRLAIINNRTFEAGEEGELVVNAGRVRVVVKEIKDDSVRVLINGQERVLRMRPGA